MRTFISLTLLFALTSITGCSDQQSTDTASESGADPSATAVAINKTCPIMGSAVTDDGGRYDWHGKTVGFCCPECIEAFAEMSDEEKTQALADADDSSADHGDHDHGEHDHGHEDAEESTES